MQGCAEGLVCLVETRLGIDPNQAGIVKPGAMVARQPGWDPGSTRLGSGAAHSPDTYGKVKGFVFGWFGEISTDLDDAICSAAKQAVKHIFAQTAAQCLWHQCTVTPFCLRLLQGTLQVRRAVTRFLKPDLSMSATILALVFTASTSAPHSYDDPIPRAYAEKITV